MKKTSLKYLDKIPIPILAVNKAQTITWINQFFLKNYNINEHTIIGKNVDEILQIKNNNQIFSINSLPKFSQILEVELFKINPLGWFKIQKFRVNSADFQELIIFTDVSEYIHDIQERVNSELNYQTIFQNAPYSNVLLQIDGIVLDCNQKTSQIFELPVEEMIGNRYSDLIKISTELYNFYENLAEQIRNGVEPTPFPTKITTLKGNEKFLEIYPHLIRKNNQPSAIHLIIHDLTEEKRTERKLEESITVFGAFMSNFSGIAFIKSPKGEYIYLNKALIDLVNQDPQKNFTYEECLNKTDFDLFTEKDAKIFRKNDLQVLHTLTATHMVETTNVNGTLRSWFVNKFPLANEEKSPWAVAGMGVDVTDQKESEFFLKIQSDFGFSLNEVTELDELFKLCISTAMRLPEIDLIGIYILNSKSGDFDLKYSEGGSKNFVEKVKTDQFRRNGISIFQNKKAIYRDLNYIEISKNSIIPEEGIKSYCLIPIITENGIVGAFNVASRHYKSISTQTGNVIELISAQLGTKLEKIWAQEKIKLNEERLEVLLQLNQMNNESEENIFNFALEKAVQLTNSTHGFISQVDIESKQITQMRIWSIHSRNVPPVFEFPDQNQEMLKTNPWKQIVKTKKPLIMNSKIEMGQDLQLFPKIPREIFRYIAVPVLIRDRLFAIAGVWNKNENYEDSDINQLTLIIEAVASLIQKRENDEQQELYRQQLEKTVDQITLNEQRLEALLKINQMTNASEEQIYDNVLRESVNLTRSQSGFLSFINKEGKIKSMRVWSKSFKDGPKTFEMPLETQDLDKGVWIDVIHSKKPVIVNDTTKSELAQRLLHPNQQINRYMLVPVYIGEQLFAIAGLGNKKENYNDSDLRQILLLIDSVTTLIQKKQDEEQREFYRRELEKTEKINALGILAGGIAHDFNNILTAILGNVSLAEISKDTDELQDRLIEAKKAILRSKELTQQLLTFAKGGSPIKKLSTIDMLLRDTVDFVLRGSNVRVEYNIADNLWAAEIDEGQISQVINNLVLNSIQAMPKGGTISIIAKNKIIHEESKFPLVPGNYIMFKICDEGVGIPEKYLDQIFDPYFTTKEAGSGLGLATSYAIISKHGGYISVQSSVGEGSVFSVIIPAISNKKPKEADKMIEELMYGTGKILVMDDEEIIRKVAKRMLEKLGYQVTTTNDGEETIIVYQEAFKSREPFDVVILDLTIPGGKGGKETLIELKKLNPNLKAIVSSGYSVDSIMSDYKKFGFSGIITKPWKYEEFSKVIHTVLNSS
jgi:PAS domain S-box-containing protein